MSLRSPEVDAPHRASARSWWRTYRWLLMGVLAMGVLLLGTYGFLQWAHGTGEDVGFLDASYLSVQLVAFQSGAVSPPVPWALQVSRFLFPAVVYFTAFSVLAVLFREQIEALPARRLNVHVVVCGLGRKGALPTRPLRVSGRRPFEFACEEVAVLGEMEHERWMDELLRLGWRYAPGEKDVDRRTSPYLVPWNALPEAVKEDDRIFARRLPHIPAEVGYRIVRVSPPGAGR
jgi:hypothetical protein